MRLLVITLVGLLLVMQVRLWVGKGSVADVWRIRHAAEVQRSENDRLRMRNAALAAEVSDLKRGSAAIEERARSELGMIKEGETFFQVIMPAAEPRYSNHKAAYSSE